MMTSDHVRQNRALSFPSNRGRLATYTKLEVQLAVIAIRRAQHINGTLAASFQTNGNTVRRVSRFRYPARPILAAGR